MHPKYVCLGKSLMMNFLSSSKKKSTYNVHLKTFMRLKVVFMIDMFLSFRHTDGHSSDKIVSVWTSQHVFDMSILTKTWQEEGFWIWRQKSCQLIVEESKTYSWYISCKTEQKIRARLSFPRGAVKWRVSFSSTFFIVCILFTLCKSYNLFWQFK